MKKTLFVIFAILFVNAIGFGLIIPLLPFYAKHYGASFWVIGLLFGTFSIAQLLGAPFVGSIADRYGRRPALLLSLLGTAIGFAIMAFAQNLWMLFLGRLIDGLSGGNVSIARAYIADLLSEKDRAKGYGILGAAFGLGFIIGPAISGFTMPLGYHVPLLIALGFTLLTLLLAWLYLPETLSQKQKISLNPIQQLLYFLKMPHVNTLILIDFLLWSTFAIYQTTFPIFVKGRFSGVEEHHVGYMLSFLGGLGAFFQGFLVRRYAHRLGDKTMLLLGMLIGGAGLFFAAFSPYLWLFLLMMIPTTLGNSFMVPAILSLLSKKVPQTMQGRLQGATSAAESLARIMGPVIGYALLHWYPQSAYALPALILFLLPLWSKNLNSLK